MAPHRGNIQTLPPPPTMEVFEQNLIFPPTVRHNAVDAQLRIPGKSKRTLLFNKYCTFRISWEGDSAAMDYTYHEVEEEYQP